MPFKSKKQMRWAFATDQPFAKEWAKKTKDPKRLPEASKSASVAGMLAALDKYNLGKFAEWSDLAEGAGDRIPLPSREAGGPLADFLSGVNPEESVDEAALRERKPHEKNINWSASAGMNSGDALERSVSNVGIPPYGGV